MAALSKIQLQVWGQNLVPNTFIGGIAKLGGTGVNTPINTKSLLATKLNIASNRISGFKIIGDNVQCRIEGAYVFPPNFIGNSSPVNANSNITYYVDTDNIANKYAITRSSAWAFANCPNLNELKVNGAVYINEGFACHNPKLQTLELGALLGCVGQAFWDNPKLLSFTAINFTNVGGDNSMFANNILMTEAITPSINKLQGFHYSGCVKLIQAIHDKAVSVGQLAFFNCTSIELISLKKAKTLVATLTPQYVFNNIKIGCLIKVNDFLRTSNSGLADNALTYAKNIRGATVEFYDDLGNYVSTL